MEINIGIDAKNRAQIGTGPGRVLADTYTPYLETQRLHVHEKTAWMLRSLLE